MERLYLFLWYDCKNKEHFSEFVDTLVGRISPHSANSNSQSVLDIGCNDGSLLELFDIKDLMLLVLTQIQLQKLVQPKVSVLMLNCSIKRALLVF